MPGTLAGGGAPFVTTHWSVIASAACEDEKAAPDAEAALARLCRDYWAPLYNFVRRRGYNRADAQDLVQSFFAFFLRTKTYARGDPARGRFRSFLLASLKNFIADAWDREHAAKRFAMHKLALLDDEVDAIEAVSLRESKNERLNEEQHFERRWAAALVGRALSRVGEEFAAGSKERIFQELKPFLTGGVRLPAQEEVAARLQMPVATLRSHLSRLRARYRVLLREEVTRTVAKAEDVDEELYQLCTVLSEAY